MWLLFELFIYALTSFLIGPFLISAFLAKFFDIGNNKIIDIIKIAIVFIVIVCVFSLGSYMDIFSDFETRKTEDYLITCYLYTISIISSFSLFFYHDSQKKDKSFIQLYLGDFSPSISSHIVLSYTLILSFFIESFLRIKSHCSLIQCYWIFNNYLPSTLEEELKYTPADGCSYFILVFSSLCFLCMLCSDLRHNRNGFVKSLSFAAFFVALIFLPINIYRYFNYYIPSNYNVNNSILRNSDIELLEDNINDLIFEEKVSSLGNITLGESCQTVDREIREYIESIEKDSVAYIFDNKTFIRCITCLVKNNRVQVLSLRLENRHNINQSDCKFVRNRAYALAKTDQYEKYNFNRDLEGHLDYFETSKPSINENWKPAINTITKKYGQPSIIGTELSRDFSFNGNKTYYWIVGPKIIKFHIYKEDNIASLTYIKRSYIGDIVSARELELQKERDYYRNLLKVEEEKARQEYIDSVNKAKASEQDRIEIQNKTIEDI